MANYRLKRILPKTKLYDSVWTKCSIVRNWLHSFTCDHPHKTNFTIVDHRPGPGWMSDTYEGSCCRTCGRILKCERTY